MLLTALGVVVLVIAYVALRNPHSDTASAGSNPTFSPPPVATTSPLPHPHTSTSPTFSVDSTSVAATTSSTPPGVAKLPLIVLNNTKIAGLATQAKVAFEGGGWTVTSTGNIVNNIISTCAYYDPSVPGAQAAAEALRQQFPAIKRTVPKFAELPPGPIVVVLTTDYASS